MYARLAGDDPEAVVLDLVQPLAAVRQLDGFGWKARRDETGREARHTQHCGLKLKKDEAERMNEPSKKEPRAGLRASKRGLGGLAGPLLRRLIQHLLDEPATLSQAVRSVLDSTVAE